MQTDSAVTTTEEVLTAVADPRRRELLRYLRDIDSDVVSVAELATELANGPGDRDRLGVRLRHAHLPKLADVGVLTFDPRSSTVRYTGNEQVASLLEFVETELE
jgi:predicted transcriptional regulator